MAKIVPRLYLIVFLIFFGIQIENVFTGLDSFGFIVGMYGIQLGQPYNQFATLFVMILLVLIGGLVGTLLQRYRFQRYGHLISISLISIIYVMTIKRNVNISLIFDMVMFTFIYLVYIHIKNKPNISIETLQTNLRFLTILLSVIIIVAIINYIMWFDLVENFDISKTRVSYQVSFLILILGQGPNYVLDIPYNSYIATGYQYARSYQTGFGISLVFRPLVLGYFIYLTWRQINNLIDLIHGYPKVWKITQNDEQSHISLKEVNELAPKLDQESSEYKSDVKEIDMDFDKYFEIADLLNSELVNMYRASGASTSLGEQSINLRNEKEIIELSKGMNLELNLIDFFRGQNNLKKPILLQNLDLEDFSLENTALVNDDLSMNMSGHFFTTLRYLNQKGLPENFSKIKSILHIGSNNIESNLIDRNLKSLSADYPVQYEFVPIGSKQELDKIKERTKKKIDILIITLHGSIDKKNVPYFLVGNGEASIRVVHEELSQVIISTPRVVLIPSCLSYVSNSTSDLPTELLKRGSVLTLSSVAPVLSSHLSLILLSALGVLLPLDKLTIFDIQKMTEEIYQNIKKFGYLLQWGTLRSLLRQKID